MSDLEELERLARACSAARSRDDLYRAGQTLLTMTDEILSLLEEHKALREAATAAYEDYCNNGHYVSAETGYVLGCALGLHDDAPSQALGDSHE